MRNTKELGDKSNNNGESDKEDLNKEEKSPEEHKFLADVLVNIENKIDKPKKFEGEFESKFNYRSATQMGASGSISAEE